MAKHNGVNNEARAKTETARHREIILKQRREKNK